MTEVDDVKYEAAAATRALVALGLAGGVNAHLGHIALRLPSDPERFVVKGRGYQRDLLSLMRPEQMVVCDLDGRLVEGPPGIQQCFEVMLHARALAARPDANAVLHVHPRFLVLLSALGRTVKPMRLEGSQLLAEPLPVYPHAKVVVEREDAEEVVVALGARPAVLMQGHGVLAVGRGAGHVATMVLNLEEQAHMNWLALAVGGEREIDAAQPLFQEILAADHTATQPSHFSGPLVTNRQSLWDQTLEEVAAGFRD